MSKLSPRNPNPPRLDGQTAPLVEDNADAAALARRTLLSAGASRDAVRTAPSAGIDAFVIKPFSVGSLIERMNRASRRTAGFVVDPADVGPDRRTQAGSGRKRLTDVPPPANDLAPDSSLRLSPCADPDADEPVNSLLMELYAHIRALEAERCVVQG